MHHVNVSPHKVRITSVCVCVWVIVIPWLFLLTQLQTLSHVSHFPHFLLISAVIFLTTAFSSFVRCCLCRCGCEQTDRERFLNVSFRLRVWLVVSSPEVFGRKALTGICEFKNNCLIQEMEQKQLEGLNAHLIKMNRRSTNVGIVCILVFVRHHQQNHVKRTAGQPCMVRKYKARVEQVCSWFLRKPRQKIQWWLWPQANHCGESQKKVQRNLKLDSWDLNSIWGPGWTLWGSPCRRNDRKSVRQTHLNECADRGRPLMGQRLVEEERLKRCKYLSKGWEWKFCSSVNTL